MSRIRIAAALLVLAAAFAYVQHREREHSKLLTRACHNDQIRIMSDLFMLVLDHKLKVDDLVWSPETAALGHFRGVYHAACPTIPGGDGGWKFYRFVPDGNGMTCLIHGHRGSTDLQSPLSAAEAREKSRGIPTPPRHPLPASIRAKYHDARFEEHVKMLIAAAQVEP